MKNLFIVLVLVCFLTSCDKNTTINSVSLNEQKDLTTIEMQESVKADTAVYKVIEKNGCVYLVNPSTNLVEKEVKQEMTAGDALLLIICIALIICFILF